MVRILTALAAGAAALLLAGPAVGQESSPSSEAGVCAPADIVRFSRAVNLALNPNKLPPNSGELIVAIVQPEAPRDLGSGTPVRIVQVLKGNFAAATALADRNPTLACLSDGVWVDSRPVVGVFLAHEQELTTLIAVPYSEGRAIIDGRFLTVQELMDLGKNFVEATPTALPAGIAPPPTFERPPGAGDELPAAGRASGDEASVTRSSGPLYVAVALLAVGCIAGAMLLLRTRR